MSQTTRMTALVVEDEPLILMDLADTLARRGILVIEAGSLVEAMRIVGSGVSVDVLVTDVDLPGGLSGVELAHLVATARPNARIIVASGRTVMTEPIPQGAVFLPKPYNPETIADIVEVSAARAA